MDVKITHETDGRSFVEALLGGRAIAQDVIDLRVEQERQRFAKSVHAAAPAVDICAINDLLLNAPKDRSGAAVDEDFSWPPAVSLARAAAPEFPVAALPHPLRDFVTALAEATQTPTAMAGLLGLVACSSMASRRIWSMPRAGWKEPINLFGVCVLEPGNRKSAVFADVMRPIRDIERELRDQARPEVARAASERRVKETMLNKLEKEAAKGDLSAKDDAMRLAMELAATPVPEEPMLIADDATPEAVAKILASQGGRLLVAGCEGGLFATMAGRYSRGCANLDVFLQGHAGEDIRVSRVQRDELFVKECCLSVCYAVQPDVIHGMAQNPSFRGRGLIGRFMFAVPESPLGRRRIAPAPVPDTVAAAYTALIRRLSELRPVDDRPACVTLGADAASRFMDWEHEVEAMLADDGRLSNMKDWGGKLCGLTARLAAVLHLISNTRPEPWHDPVSRETVDEAITLSRWAIDHAALAISMMNGEDNEAVADARFVLRRIREQDKTEINQRDIHILGRARFDGQPERLDKAVRVLIDRGWIREALTAIAPRGPGRPASPRYLVRPDKTIAASSTEVPASSNANVSSRLRGVI